MRECGWLIMLALVYRTMAVRNEAEDKHRLTACKCCKAAGNMFYPAADQLGSAAAKPGDVTVAMSTFSEQICVQGSTSSTSWSSSCKMQNYVFPGFTIKFTNVETLVKTACPASIRCHDKIRWLSVRKGSELRKGSERKRAEALHCNTNSIQRKSNAINCDKRPTVAIFADYDGCWDIISQVNPKQANERWFDKNTPNKSYKQVTLPLRKKIEEITAGKRVVLFMGSNRQSWEDDTYNYENNGNGLALGKGNSFESWVQEYGGLENNCWELNTALLSDDEQPCSSWNDQRESPWVGWSQEKTKTKLLENGIKQLLLEDHVDLYFFDDHAEYLEHVRLNARIPPNMQLYTIHYDWFDYAKGTTTGPLQEIAA